MEIMACEQSPFWESKVMVVGIGWTPSGTLSIRAATHVWMHVCAWWVGVGGGQKCEHVKGVRVQFLQLSPNH